jgi:hypothetical protein
MGCKVQNNRDRADRDKMQRVTTDRSIVVHAKARNLNPRVIFNHSLNAYY